MRDKFIQRTLELNPEESTGSIKVAKLIELIDNHWYKEGIYSTFDIESIKDEVINIDFIDKIYREIRYLNENYFRYVIKAEIKNIRVYENEFIQDGQNIKDIIFGFEEFLLEGKKDKDLNTIAIYEAKNTFFDEYSITKYANHLFKKGEGELVRYNLDYFKKKAQVTGEFNKFRNYRLVENEGKVYLRGITSTNAYYEYGVDFCFVVSMLILHSNMKREKGLQYKISSVAINESKLEIIATEKHYREGGTFGKVLAAIKISTNDLGKGSLNFTNIIRVGRLNESGFFLIRRKGSVERDKFVISHTMKPMNVFEVLNDIGSKLNTSEEFIRELHEVKTIKTPDELRLKILFKVRNPKSPFKHIRTLEDIFKKNIKNEIASFSKLMEMCNKAEELQIEYDLKDKLRYIISDILLYGNTSV